MKKVFGIYIIIAAIAIGLYVIFSTRATLQSPSSETLVPTINPADLPRGLNAGAISYTTSQTQSFPHALPLYRVVDTNIALASQLVKTLGITSEGRKITAAKGSYTIYEQDTKALTLSDLPLTISYNNFSAVDAFVHDNEDVFTDLSLKTLSQMSLVPEPFSFRQTGIHFLIPSDSHPHETTSLSQAKVVRIEYGFFLDNIALFLGDTTVPGLVTTFNANHDLVELNSFIVPSVIKESETIPIISYEEAVDRLKSNTGILSSANASANTEDLVTDEVPSNIQIEDTKLGYYLASSAPFLEPVFVFVGTGVINFTTVQTTTIISATP